MIHKFYKSTSLQTLFRKSQFTIFAITFLICTFTFATISVFTVKSFAEQNLQLISRTVSERIQPALVFQDKIALSQILHEYTQQHSVRLIEVYDHQDQKISESIKSIDHYSALQNLFDHIFLHDAINVAVLHNGNYVGKIILYGSSNEILIFIIKIFVGLGIGMLFMILALWWSVNLTYRHIMQSMTPIVQIAQLVSTQSAYNLRFPKNDIQEFNHLNGVFNQLLEEIQSWHTHLQKENQQLSYQVQHDHLTGLPNRSYFYQALIHSFKNTSTKQQIALLFIDTNNFKVINDQYGHQAGDAVLKEMAARLKQNIRQDDFVARLSGDEFAIILSSIQRVDHLISIAENLIKSCEKPLIYKNQSIAFSFSLGIALSNQAISPEDLISQADQAMYKAKSLTHHWFIYHN
ncbi:diguanylate cyclase domain-containing protein [Acinetobacter sichuanensis]|uniref:Diguanylate cyclase domain-containing protein n=1 Tax=Acinetobacter sichuanensis TaxID=2136183 RepID=A0A371YJX6_9GAMM|nr:MULTISPECIES: sensor domain-containing diguanylate cyclase [Acinetobacter]MDM1249054.1 diguanylate cyclase [Acinetobacter sp. R933-2]MDM1765554.1 diguanylate cyclase [Acinetobacter sp. 226-1]MDM1769209.1 diguanylate cyclase [Acinetobacter sp. 226-4]MDQ9022912.1 diguanylate cyclase [Acinetobacter sichuanensis]RFC81773.1 sensor domain-containing diguanylate cyclase [Acinetobacter sichuanensis]